MTDRRRVDLSDVLALVGLLLVGAGVWLLSPAAALIVVGSVLLVVGLAGAWVRGRGQPPQAGGS